MLDNFISIYLKLVLLALFKIISVNKQFSISFNREVFVSFLPFVYRCCFYFFSFSITPCKFDCDLGL